MIALSKQCSFQPPDEPESSQEILEAEGRVRRRERLAKNEIDQPVETEDHEEALTYLRQRTSDCLCQEEPVPAAPADEGGVIQKDNPLRHAVRAHCRFLRLRSDLIHGIFYDRHAASQAA